MALNPKMLELLRAARALVNDCREQRNHLESLARLEKAVDAMKHYSE